MAMSFNEPIGSSDQIGTAAANNNKKQRQAHGQLIFLLRAANIFEGRSPPSGVR